MNLLRLCCVLLLYLWSAACRFIPDNKSGADLYVEKCASCHGAQGEGLRSLIPAVNDPIRLGALADSLPCILRYGVKGDAARGNQSMPAFSELEADDIVALWQHLWDLAGRSDQKITLADVKRSGCAD